MACWEDDDWLHQWVWGTCPDGAHNCLQLLHCQRLRSWRRHRDAQSPGQAKSFTLAIWSFFLVQAAFVLIPARLTQQPAADLGEEVGGSPDGFGRAYHAAEQALDRLATRVAREPLPSPLARRLLRRVGQDSTSTSCPTRQALFPVSWAPHPLVAALHPLPRHPHCQALRQALRGEFPVSRHPSPAIIPAPIP